MAEGRFGGSPQHIPMFVHLGEDAPLPVLQPLPVHEIERLMTQGVVGDEMVRIQRGHGANRSCTA